uniref:GP3 protein n=1 Tax=Free State vervet virus TaxID=1737586 RepID=A0A159D6V0_9NIDO|nr:GP3 protein [Free State vervet virus]
MGPSSVFGVLSLSSLLCCVYSYCFVFPNPDIHIQVILNYTTCHMQGAITAGVHALGSCQSFKHDQFSGKFETFNLNYSTAAPVGAVVLGLQLLNHHHLNCSWNNTRYCCSQHLPQRLSTQQQVLPHLILLGGAAMFSGMLSACRVVGRRYTTFLG